MQLFRYPDDVTPNYYLSQTFVKQERYEDAEVAIRKVVDEKPDFSDGWILLSEILVKLGRSEEAQDARDKGS